MPEYPVSASVLQGSTLGPTVLLLYTNDPSDEVNCNTYIYAQGFPYGAAGGGRGGASYDFLPPPIKTDTPNGKPQKHPRPLRSKAHFQEMILEKKPQ